MQQGGTVEAVINAGREPIALASADRRDDDESYTFERFLSDTLLSRSGDRLPAAEQAAAV